MSPAPLVHLSPQQVQWWGRAGVGWLTLFRVRALPPRREPRTIGGKTTADRYWKSAKYVYFLKNVTNYCEERNCKAGESHNLSLGAKKRSSAVEILLEHPSPVFSPSHYTARVRTCYDVD